jgi:predicted DNA-binding transcriptional regulator YafY
MATNKNASYRYRVIDNCLKNTARKWTLNNLIEVISEKLEEDLWILKGVSKRTVQNDISIMRSMYPRGFDAPIVCKDGFYFYDDPEYSINNSPLNESDIDALQEAIAIFRQFKSIPVFEELNSMILKLEGKILSEKDDRRNIIAFEKVENVKGINYIKPIYGFIKDKKVIEVSYQPFSLNEKLGMIIHPYLVKEYNNRWFLIGYNEELGKMSHLALDRIQAIHSSERSFMVKKEFDENLYFNNILGITLPENAKPEKIELSFTPERAPYIKTKPIHTSQKIIKEDEYTIKVQLTLVINKELMSLLLSFGKDVKVIKPLRLKEVIKEILAEARNKYD